MKTIRVAFVSFLFVINEVSPATDPEWVELFTSEPANLNKCSLYLHDSEDTKQKIIFTEDIKVENNYFVIKKGDFNWTGNWLNNNGDTVSIKCENSEDSHTYADPNSMTVGRNPDGIGNFFILTQPSEGGPNAPPTPAPTEKPSPPSPTPSPTIVATPASTPILTANKAIATKAPNTSHPEVKSLTDTRTPSAPVKTTVAPTSAPEEGEKERSTPTVFYGFMGIGAVFLAAGSYPFAKKIYNEKHASDEKIP